jgi:hypothetical protein
MILSGVDYARQWLKLKRGREMRGKDITGKKSYKLEALYNTGEKSTNNDYLWCCKCDCGNTTLVSIGNFNSGHTKSCGCIKKESAAKRDGSHGLGNTSEYTSWRKIRERCYNPKDKLYSKYGEIGILMSPSWESGFVNFYADMGDKPEPNYTVDRIDPNKGYSKENCRWASPYVQSRNKLPSSTGSSRFKGVQWEKSSCKWIASFTLGDIKARKIGRYTNEEHAAAAYNLATTLVFGENSAYTQLNPISCGYGVVNTNCKFFNVWVPVLVEKRKELYEEGEIL